MRLRLRLAQLLVLAPLGSLAACESATPSSRDAGPLSDGAPIITCGEEVLYSGEPTEIAEIGEISDGTFTAWQSGDAVPFRWGFQGGVMLTPTVRAPTTIDASGERCVVVEIRHLQPEGQHVFDGFPSFVARLEAVESAGALQLASLFDQIGWSEIPRDTPLTLDVTVRGTHAAAHTRLDVRVVPPGSGLPEHCDALPTTGSGCLYRRLPATARVLAIRPRTEDDGDPICPAETLDPQIVEVELTVDAPYGDCTARPTMTRTFGIQGYLAPPASCVAAIGLEAGSTFAVTLAENYVGTCVPFTLDTAVFDDPMCTAACLGMP
jgi:hypothetical protein